MHTFIEQLMLIFLPRPMVGSLLRKTREFILDESENYDKRFWAIDNLVTSHYGHLYGEDYGEDFVDCFVRIGANESDTGSVRSVALYGLWKFSEKSAIAAENLLSIFLKSDKHHKFDSLGGMDRFVFRFPLDSYMPEIVSAIRDKTLPARDRERIMRAVSDSVPRPSQAYNGLTNATIAIAEDATEDYWTRICAMRTLHPVKHKDVLWALKSDTNEKVRMEAIDILNRDPEEPG